MTGQKDMELDVTLAAYVKYRDHITFTLRALRKIAHNSQTIESHEATLRELLIETHEIVMSLEDQCKESLK